MLAPFRGLLSGVRNGFARLRTLVSGRVSLQGGTGATLKRVLVPPQQSQLPISPRNTSGQSWVPSAAPVSSPPATLVTVVPLPGAQAPAVPAQAPPQLVQAVSARPMRRGALPTPFVPSTPLDTTLVPLRRRAAFEMFRVCDLGPPPRILFHYTDAKDEVDEGIGKFLTCIGMGPARPDNGVLRDTLTRLNRLDQAYVRLDMAGRVDWLGRLLAGDAEQAALVMEELEVQSRGRSVMSDWLEGACPPSLSHMVALAQSAPAQDERRDALLMRLNHSLAGYFRLKDALAGGWPQEWYSGDKVTELAGALDGFQREEVKLTQMTLFSVDMAEVCISAMEGANATLGQLLAQARQLTGQSEAAPVVQGTVVSSHGEALSFFGFVHGATPSKDELHASWRRMRLNHHPDWPGLSQEEMAARVETSAMADSMLELIEQRASR